MELGDGTPEVLKMLFEKEDINDRKYFKNTVGFFIKTDTGEDLLNEFEEPFYEGLVKAPIYNRG
uniref:Uncharacterized protein n=1 Tax=Geoglobus ahangari TaxID=113653 RepID=A0A7C4S675_9EURY